MAHKVFCDSDFGCHSAHVSQEMGWASNKGRIANELVEEFRLACLMIVDDSRLQLIVVSAYEDVVGQVGDGRRRKVRERVVELGVAC